MKARAQTVLMMSSIYNAARPVVAWMVCISHLCVEAFW